MKWSAPGWSATAIAVALRTHREFSPLATPVKLPSSTCRTACLGRRALWDRDYKHTGVLQFDGSIRSRRPKWNGVRPVAVQPLSRSRYGPIGSSTPSLHASNCHLQRVARLPSAAARYGIETTNVQASCNSTDPPARGDRNGMECALLRCYRYRGRATDPSGVLLPRYTRQTAIFNVLHGYPANC
jgi:hypothetical protein